MVNGQIKSRKRVTEYGEVFTNEREVNAMLDLVKEEVDSITCTFLEPACGNGNFLVEILQRKLTTVEKLYGNDSLLFRNHMIEAVCSIYGVDIQEDNVKEGRLRLISVCKDKYFDVCGKNASAGLLKALSCILERNIICGNTLTGLDNKGLPLKFSEWKLNEDGMFERKDYLFSDIIDNKPSSIQKRAHKYNWTEAA